MNKEDLLRSADLCVKCGLCLPHCPTYMQTRDENESPRGRIALMQGWASGQLGLSDKLVEHVDNCLLCRACERACPAQVPYGQLVDNFRAQTPPKRGTLANQAALWLMRHPSAIHRLGRWGQRLQKYIPQRWYARIAALLPSRQIEENRFTYPAQGKERARVLLFTGCTGDSFDGMTLHAALEVLPRLGITVDLPQEQVCCGALDLHAGRHETARTWMTQNIPLFNDERYDAILSLASGCGATLQEYHQHLDQVAATSCNKIQDVCHFLVSGRYLDNIKLEPVQAKVVLHTPCTLGNIMRQADSAKILLQTIPELDMVSLKHAFCCGAAGSYMLEHPVMAERLRRDLLDNALREQPHLICTSNIGCALHLRTGLIEAGAKVDVQHPLVLLHKALPASAADVT